jgi:transposase-like protein
MHKTYIRPDPSLIPVPRPVCPRCQGRMMLTCIEPGYNGPDLQIFECSKCGHVYEALGEDPMKSANP